jgi:hypothetical protein
MRWLRVNPALGVAFLALVVAVSGGAYAASTPSHEVVACVAHSGGRLYVARKCSHHGINGDCVFTATAAQ